LSILKTPKLNISSIFGQLAQPCVLCGSMSCDGLWCAACDASLPYLNAPHCPVCAVPTPQGETCGHCLKKPPAFSRTLAVFGYQFPLDRLIQSLKYHEQLALAQRFAEKLRVRIDSPPDFIIPMPLHTNKLKSRGFNQAQLIATPLARALKTPLLSCRRLRDTPSQTSLPWNERGKNVRGAFCCDMDLSGRRVALVDDVLTTGASLNELASAVKKQGATEISAWVVARSLPHEKRGFASFSKN
jgi:ComF family protein